LLQGCWLADLAPVEIDRPFVDFQGYDLVATCAQITRHIQLKGTRGRISVHRALAEKPSACVVNLEVSGTDPRISFQYRYFGGLPGVAMNIEGFSAARKSINTRSADGDFRKAEREHHVMVPSNRFSKPLTIVDLARALFGSGKTTPPVSGPPALTAAARRSVREPLASRRRRLGPSKKEEKQANRQAATGQANVKYLVRTPDGVVGPLSKRRAILAVVKAIVAAGVPIEEIKRILRSEHVSASGVMRFAIGDLASKEFVAAVSDESRAEGRAFAPARFFCGEDDLLRQSGHTYSLTNQWGPETARAIDGLLRAFSTQGVSCTLAATE
jgi:hypothetical protein